MCKKNLEYEWDFIKAFGYILLDFNACLHWAFASLIDTNDGCKPFYIETYRKTQTLSLSVNGLEMGTSPQTAMLMYTPQVTQNAQASYN